MPNMRMQIPENEARYVTIGIWGDAEKEDTENTGGEKMQTAKGRVGKMARTHDL